MKIARSNRQKAAGDAIAGPMDTETLFRSYAGFVAAFLRRLGVPAADVDDSVQEVFLVTHRKGGYVPGAAHPRTWLAAIATLIAQANARKRARRREHLELLEAADTHSSDVDPHTSLAARESLARVQRALDTLELPHRAAFVLYEIEGESCEAIAAAFDVPLGTVHSRLHHARRRFLHAYSGRSADDTRSDFNIVEKA